MICWHYACMFTLLPFNIKYTVSKSCHFAAVHPCIHEFSNGPVYLEILGKTLDLLQFLLGLWYLESFGHDCCKRV